MNKQVELALAKEWGTVNFDKVGLIQEHTKRRLEFDKNVSFLEEGVKKEGTLWIEIEQLYNQMRSEVN